MAVAETRSCDPAPSRGAGRLVRAPIDVAATLSAVADPAAGGNVLFVGTTRSITAGTVTVGLEYEAHEPMALALLEGLRAEAIARYGLCGCDVVHRLGTVAVGEASIAIAASAPHRREAFAAAEWLLARVKEAVPVWKCEEGPEGARVWVHPGGIPGRDGGAG